jgi:hypothetical protein
MAKKRKEATPHLRIRIEPELLARLEKSRTTNNRTLTGEIVHRIEQTFRKSDDADLASLVYRAAFGDRTGDLLRAFATAIWLIETRTGKKWHEDTGTGVQAFLAVDEICRWFGRGWRGEDFPAKRAARLKYGDPDAVDNIGYAPGKKFDQLLRAANTAALETLRQMGMAPSDAEIDAAAAKYHAEREKKRIEQPAINADKSKDDGEKQ